MTFLLIGFKVWSTILATLTVVMFLIDLMGLMYLWDISLNALSLVNLCAVSFILALQVVDLCSHLFILVDWYCC